MVKVTLHLTAQGLKITCQSAILPDGHKDYRQLGQSQPSGQAPTPSARMPARPYLEYNSGIRQAAITIVTLFRNTSQIIIRK
jgi:hypothetical protein